MAKLTESAYTKQCVARVCCVVEYMVTDGVTCAYHERGRLRPEGVKVIEKCDECDVWMGVV